MLFVMTVGLSLAGTQSSRALADTAIRTDSYIQCRVDSFPILCRFDQQATGGVHSPCLEVPCNHCLRSNPQERGVSGVWVIGCHMAGADH